MFLDMGRLKVVLNILDVFFFTFWGFTTIEILPFVVVHGFNFNTLNQLVAFLFSFTGLVFLGLKVYFFFVNSRMANRHQKEDLRKKEIDNNLKVRDSCLFRRHFDELSDEEFEDSRLRIIKNNNNEN